MVARLLPVKGSIVRLVALVERETLAAIPQIPEYMAIDFGPRNNPHLW